MGNISTYQVLKTMKANKSVIAIVMHYIELFLKFN